MELTEEQRAAIAERRRIAIERLQQTKQKLQEQNTGDNNNNKNKSDGDEMRMSLTKEQKAQIAANKQKALERLQKVKMTTSPVSSSPLSALSPAQQHAQTEENQRIAIEKLKIKNLVPPNFNIDSSTSKGTSTSSTSVQEQVISRPKPTGGQQKPPQKLVYCDLEICEENRFVAKTDGFHEELINEFKKINSRSYNVDTKNWTFRLEDYNQVVKIAESLKSTVVCEKVPEWILRYMRRVLPSISNESCLEDIEPTLVESLVGFQKEGVKFGIAHGGKCLIADDMGLGKTRQALAIADFFKDDWPLLIVTNASTRNFWESEISELLPNIPMHYITVINSSSDSIDDAKIVISSYAGLDTNFQKLMRKHFGMIIFDESHSLKNPKSKQTLNAQRLAEKAHRIVMITGTPALSRPVELFTQLEMLDKTFASYKSFSLRYCAGRQSSFGWDASGSSHLDELNVVLRKQFMIRRIKNEVYSELGDKMREIITLQNLDLTKRFTDGTQEIDMSGYAKKFDNVRGKIQESVLLQWYNATADIKAKAVCSYIEKLLQTERKKFLIFAHHKLMMDAISEALNKINISYIRIDGSTRTDIRTINVNRFQNDEDVRCAVLSIRTCNAGITLTAAKTVVFAELDWNPSTINQAEGRAHRIGQDGQVRVKFLLAPGTADDVIWRKLQDKQSNLGKVGLCATNEHLGQNVATSFFEAVPSPAKKMKQMTDYYQKVSSPRTEKSNSSSESELFYSCQDIETTATTSLLLDEDDDFVLDINSQELLKELEKKENSSPNKFNKSLTTISQHSDDLILNAEIMQMLDSA